MVRVYRYPCINKGNLFYKIESEFIKLIGHSSPVCSLGFSNDD